MDSMALAKSSPLMVPKIFPFSAICDGDCAGGLTGSRPGLGHARNGNQDDCKKDADEEKAPNMSVHRSPCIAVQNHRPILHDNPGVLSRIEITGASCRYDFSMGNRSIEE